MGAIHHENGHANLMNGEMSMNMQRLVAEFWFRSAFCLSAEPRLSQSDGAAARLAGKRVERSGTRIFF
jgi:hypothetical protein